MGKSFGCYPSYSHKTRCLKVQASATYLGSEKAIKAKAAWDELVTLGVVEKFNPSESNNWVSPLHFVLKSVGDCAEELACQVKKGRGKISDFLEEYLSQIMVMRHYSKQPKQIWKKAPPGLQRPSCTECPIPWVLY